MSTYACSDLHGRFDLFKSTAWKIFDDQSSGKKTNDGNDDGYEQMVINFLLIPEIMYWKQPQTAGNEPTPKHQFSKAKY